MATITRETAIQQFIVLYLGLPPKRKDRVNRLLALLKETDDADEQRELAAAVEEIVLSTKPGRTEIVDLDEGVDASAHVKMSAYRAHTGRMIRERRKALGMTQEQLAEKAGLPQPHISRLEAGMHAPTNVTIEKLAAALSVEPSALDLLLD